MITEFTCGIYTAKVNAEKWRLETNHTTIAIIEKDGIAITFTGRIFLTTDCLVEISVLMNNIKRQYKQLQTT